MAVTAGDLNQDGFSDLIVGNFGENRCFINQGDGSFQLASTIPFLSDSFTTGLAVADVTGDDLPDLVQVNYIDDPAVQKPVVVRSADFKKELPDPLDFTPAHDFVWVSSGTDTQLDFKLIELRGSANSGFEPGTGLGVVISDLDPQRPGLEIFVANDMRPNHFWIRTENTESQFAFQNIARVVGCAVSSKGHPNACMGIALADFNRDGLSDLLVTNFYDEWANFFVRQKSVGYRDVAAKYQLDLASDELVGFGCQPIDYDNNGAIDVVVANGHIDDLTYKGYSFRMPSQLLVNRMDRFAIADQSEIDYWKKPHLGRCVVRCDFNRDGLMDVGITDLKDPFALLENQTSTDGNWIQLRLVGTESERDAIGARVRLSVGNDVYHTVIATGDGFEGKNEALVSFGLGNSPGPVDVNVQWPSGQQSRYQALVSGSRYLLIENEVSPWGEHLR
jgi:hypothetical protein